MIFKELIKEICDEQGINYNVISKGWIIVLKKNAVTNIITGYKFGLNNHALGELLDDKYATYELLRKEDFPIIEHNIVYAQTNNNEYAEGNNNLDYIIKLFNKYNKNVVLKVNDGTCGTNVLRIKEENVLVDSYKKLSKKYFSMSICPFYSIQNEYRAIVLNEKIELLYKKIKPEVIGDGIHSKKELLMEFNNVYFNNIEEQGLNGILKSGEKYEYDWRFNLSKGAKASLEIEDYVKNNIIDLATKVAKSIGLSFGSIDIIHTQDKQLYVMEINSGVMMENFIKQIPNGYEIAKKIYSNAINSYDWGMQ